MRDYAITTDSSCDFDQALADSLGVTVVPLSVQIGPRRFRNAPGEAMDSHSFYQLLSQGELAQTSAPNVEEFKAVWRPILQSGRDLLYLGFSSGLSGTYHNAAIAAEDLREEFPEARIITVDTLCASLGQGMLVDLTVQEKRQGKTLDEAAAFAEKNRLYLCHWFTVGDLSQLRRGGRLSAGKAIVGNLLNIKPVLHVDDEGHLVPMASAKGRKKSIEALVSHMEESAVSQYPARPGPCDHHRAGKVSDHSDLRDFVHPLVCPRGPGRGGQGADAELRRLCPPHGGQPPADHLPAYPAQHRSSPAAHRRHRL